MKSDINPAINPYAMMMHGKNPRPFFFPSIPPPRYIGSYNSFPYANKDFPMPMQEHTPKSQTVLRRKWSEEEDELLKTAVEKYGLKKWSLISTMVPNKNPKQCRERWIAQLNPCLSKTNWSYEEDQILLQAQKMYGNHWTKIATFLPGRCGNSVKNRYLWLKKRSLTSSYVTTGFSPNMPSSLPKPNAKISPKFKNKKPDDPDQTFNEIANKGVIQSLPTGVSLENSPFFHPSQPITIQSTIDTTHFEIPVDGNEIDIFSSDFDLSEFSG